MDFEFELEALLVRDVSQREALLQLRRSRRTVSMSRDEADEEGGDWDFADDAPLPGDVLNAFEGRARR